MTSERAGARCVRLFALLLFVVLPLTALAQGTHSGLDQRVTALSAHQILTQEPAALVDPERQVAAQDLARVTRTAFFLSALLEIAALFYFWRSGWAARLRDSLRRRFRSTVLVRFAFGALLALVPLIAALPVSFVVYRLLRNAGLYTETARAWFKDYALGSAIEALIIGLVIVAILALVDRTRRWYLYVIAGSFAIALFGTFVYPVTIAPLFNKYEPMAASAPLYGRLHGLTERAGLGDLPIYVTNLSIRTPLGNAYLVGFGGTRRVVIGDTLLRSVTDDEVAFVVAHEIGHQVHKDALFLTLIGALVFILCATLAVLSADRIGVRRDDDPLARLALVGAFLVVYSLLVTPLFNGFSRKAEAAADAYALSLTHDRVAGARTFIRFTDDGLALLCPGRLARLYFYNHPPNGSRIAAMTAKRDPCP